jgi:N-acetylglucosaminyldiphosphoundecaprenol N-acetyl-beta-D-mannosaminyltransferase
LAWQRLGLEWLYRMVQEPKRLWKRYLVTNTLFCGMVLAALLRRLPQRRERSDALR